MSIPNIPVGNVARIDGHFTDATQAPADPTEVVVTITLPDATEETFAFSLDEVDKVTTGHFRLDYELATAGDYRWKMVGTGAIDAERSGVINAFDHYASP